jgi:putative aldouronate transport system permease protein
VPIWNVIILMNFFRGLPKELSEAASIDGASHWDILFRLYLPLSLPALATLTLFSAVGHWNSWFDGMIYIRQPSKVPLQTYLKKVIVDNNLQGLMAASSGVFEQVSRRSLQAAQVTFAMVPILMLYPFLQRYFLHGLTLGSVKG